MALAQSMTFSEYIYVCVCTQTLRLPQSVQFAVRAKDERSLIRDKRLGKKKNRKKLESGKTETSLYRVESKRRCDKGAGV